MFDPYHKWLGIPKDQRPPTCYQLLGVATGETDREVIEEAAVRQTAHVRTYQIGKHADDCTRILNEIAQAKLTLLNPAKRKAYDESLARSKHVAQTDVAQTAVKAPATGILVSTPASAPDFRLQDAPAAEPPLLSRTRLNAARRSRSSSAALWIAVGAASLLAVVVGIVVALKLGGGAEPVRPHPPATKKDDKRDPKIHPKAAHDPGGDRDKPAVAVKPAAVKSEPKEPPLVVKPPPMDRPAVAVKAKAHPGARGFPVKEKAAWMSLAPDGKKLAVSFIHAHVYDTTTGEYVATLEPTKPGGSIHTPVAFLPNGLRVLYAYGGEPVVVIGEAATGAALHRLTQGKAQYADCLAVTPDGKRALVGYNHQVVLWDLEKQAELKNWGMKHIVSFAAISRDGRGAITASKDGAICSWDLEQLEINRERKFPDVRVVHDLAISPDGKLMAIAGDMGAIFLEGPDLKRAVLDLPEDIGAPTALAFCDGGDALLAGGKDGIVRLIDFKKGRVRAAWKGHAGEVSRIAVDAQDGLAVSGDGVGMVFVWPLGRNSGGEEP